MKISLFLIPLLSLFFNRAHSQGSDPFNQEIDAASIIGTITEVKDTIVFGIDRREVTIFKNGKTTNLNLYLPNYKTADLLDKKVRISYNIYKIRNEVDMFVNNTSIYYDRNSPKDLSETSKVKGVFDIYDYGCAMPGRYSISTPKGDKIWIFHYIESKYQKPFEDKNVTVYFTTQIHKNITKISFIETPSSNRLNIIPGSFFKQTGISRFEIATKEKNFNSGCIRKPGDKHILLNYVKINKDNNTQTISLSFGGKRFYTKEYYLSYHKGKLRIKEKER